MLGPAELREINDALNEARGETVRSDKGPYLTPHFAVGMAVTRAAATGMKVPGITQPLPKR
jgi:hypothetical protein